MAIETDKLHRLWETEMEILDVIDAVCRKNNIKYSLAYGSMLGAVRHGGFIPWDDDMDIWMLREDYEKFIRVWNENPVPGFTLVNQEKYPDFTQNFTKICKNGTLFLTDTAEKERSYPQGIFVDIFALDNVSNSKTGKRLQILQALFYMLYCRGYASKHDGRINFLVSSAILGLTPKSLKSKLRKYFFNRITQYNRHGYAAEEVAAFNTAADARIFYTKKFASQWHDIKFAGHTFMCNVDVDALLTTVFGDYMKLPPAEKRKLAHSPALIDFGQGN